MKTAISLPDLLFNRAELLSQKLRLSRSRLYALALSELLRKYQEGTLTDQLNELYTHEHLSSEDAHLLSHNARHIFEKTTW